MKVEMKAIFLAIKKLPPIPWLLRNIYIITYHSYRDGPCYQLNLKQIFLTLENKVSDTKHCKIIMSCYTFIPFLWVVCDKWNDFLVKTRSLHLNIYLHIIYSNNIYLRKKPEVM